MGKVKRAMTKLYKTIHFRYSILFLVLMNVSCSNTDLLNGSNQVTVIMKTELGKIVLQIDRENAPITSANFLRNVDEKRYDNSSFYRAVRMDNQAENEIKIEIIQGGLGPLEADLRLPPIDHEATSNTGILHENGTISMARAEVGTASSEIFICLGDQPELDYMGSRNPDGQGYAAFGHVIKGMDVVRKIQGQATEKQMLMEPVKIFSVKRRLF